MKKITATAALALTMTLAGVGSASAEGKSDCGRAFGAFHSSLAQNDGPMGQVHKPGVAHRGLAGFPGCNAEG